MATEPTQANGQQDLAAGRCPVCSTIYVEPKSAYCGVCKKEGRPQQLLAPMTAAELAAEQIARGWAPTEGEDPALDELPEVTVPDGLDLEDDDVDGFDQTLLARERWASHANAGVHVLASLQSHQIPRDAAGAAGWCAEFADELAALGKKRRP